MYRKDDGLSEIPVQDNNLSHDSMNDNEKESAYLEKKLNDFEGPTLEDLADLNPHLARLYDKRSFIRLMKDILMDENSLIQLFCKRSILDPLWIRVVMFIYNLSIMFAMSALLYSDDLIDSAAKVSQEEAVHYIN
jgi:hypothetical protein